jgi:predicted RNase H-like HicB family nuclease
MDKFTIVFEKCEEGGYHAYMRENPGVQTEGETIQETMGNFIDAFELFFRDELEGEIAKQSLDADRFEIEFALAQR